MLRWTDGPDAAGHSIGGVPSVPRAATLIGATLVFMAALMPVRLVAPRQLIPGGTAVVLGSMVLSVVYGLALIVVRRLPTQLPAMIGLVLLDLLPPLLVGVAQHPADYRARALWLVAPTVIAATYRGRELPLAQTGVAMVTAAAIIVGTLGLTPESALEALTVRRLTGHGIAGGLAFG